MSEWKQYKLGDLTDVFDCPHSTPKWTDVGVFVIRSWNVRNGRLNFNKVSYTDEQTYLERIRRAKPKGGDIVLTREAPMGEVCLIPQDLKCCLGQRVVLLQPKKTVDSRFLLYSLLSPLIQKKIKSNEGTGSTVSNFRIPDIKALEIFAPQSIKTQSQIASILSSLDDKIELNLQMNQTLEAMAQAIFKEWFVNFNFPDFDGELVDGLPKGWKETILDDIVDLVIDHRGKTPTKLGGEWSEAGIPAISAKNVKDGRLINLKDVGYVSSELYSKWMKEKLQPFDILLTSEGPLGEVAILVSNIEFCLSQRLFAIRVNKDCSAGYLYLYLRSVIGKENVAKRATGSTVTGIRQSELRQVEVLLPDKPVIELFDRIVNPILEKIDQNFNEISLLTNMRDSLLPKLMTGKIEIKN